jgi:hypothetical protein
MVGFLEVVLCALALACACATRPWRLLAHGSRYDLLGPLIGFMVLLPLFWWWPGPAVSPLATLVGAQLLLLMLGWPLAMLVLAFMACAGVAFGLEAASVIRSVFWSGVVPATLALALGAAARHWLGTRPIVYLAGRAMAIPFFCVWAGASLADAVTARFQRYGASADAAVLLVAFIDAAMTSLLVVLFVMCKPRLVATWSPALYGTGEPRSWVASPVKIKTPRN